MGREWRAVLAVVFSVTACSLPISDDSDGAATVDAEPTARTIDDSAVVVESALLVAGDDGITVYPDSDDPFPIVTGEPVTATFEDGAGGLLYATGEPGGRQVVRHIPAGSAESFTLVDDLTQVFDLGIFQGLPAVIGARQVDPSSPSTLFAVQLTGEAQRLFDLPATTASVDQGGARIVLGHVDGSVAPPCTWFEIRDAAGEILEPPPGLPSEPTCVEGVDQLPPTSLSTDGRRFAIGAAGEDGSTAIRIVDLDLGGEQVVLVPDARAVDVGLTGGLVISTAGVVELAGSGNQTWLRPFPPDVDASDTISLLHSPLRLDPGVAGGETVAISDADPPGVVFLAGDVLIGPGSAGETVLNWQRQLNRWLNVSDLEEREPVAMTGVYDLPTQDLTGAFVASSGLQDDGTIDERDLDELTRQIAILENGPGVIGNGDSGNVVIRWQTQLARWIDLVQPEGLRRGVNPDGVFGDGTEDAMRVFEEATGNRQDGIVQPSDRAAMEQALIDLGAAAVAEPAEDGTDDDSDDG